LGRLGCGLGDRKDAAAMDSGEPAVSSFSTFVGFVGVERGLILALGLLVLAAELMNPGLEEVVDYISKADDPRAKKAKDCGCAAVYSVWAAIRAASVASKSRFSTTARRSFTLI
jgi:diacylglycerol kinase